MAPFRDARPLGRCGMQMNGYRMDTADVVCTETPGRWFADALATALERDGFRVLAPDAVPGPSTIIVSGVVQQLFLEPHDGWLRTVEGDFGARLVVTTVSGLHAERSFYVKGEQASLASTEGVFQSAADDATEKLAVSMSRAVIELANLYPSLGAPQATAAVARLP